MDKSLEERIEDLRAHIASVAKGPYNDDMSELLARLINEWRDLVDQRDGNVSDKNVYR